MSNFITLEDVNGDLSEIKPTTMDAFVKAELDIPAEVDEQGRPTSDKTKKAFMLVIILRNGRQVVQKFDNPDARDAKAEELKALA